MKKLIIAVVLIAGAAVFGQTTPAPYQFSVSPSTTVTNCAPVTGQTTYCFAGNGVIYVSVNGGAFATPTVTGVTSISVNGGTAQTGPVALVIPSKATVTVPAQTVTGTLQ